jgi:hypothetical protein
MGIEEPKQDEQKMIGCTHPNIELMVAWLVCPDCKWSELAAQYGMYSNEKLNNE